MADPDREALEQRRRRLRAVARATGNMDWDEDPPHPGSASHDEAVPPSLIRRIAALPQRQAGSTITTDLQALARRSQNLVYARTQRPAATPATSNQAELAQQQQPQASMTATPMQQLQQDDFPATPVQQQHGSDPPSCRSVQVGLVDEGTGFHYPVLWLEWLPSILPDNWQDLPPHKIPFIASPWSPNIPLLAIPPYISKSKPRLLDKVFTRGQQGIDDIVVSSVRDLGRFYADLLLCRLRRAIDEKDDLDKWDENLRSSIRNDGASELFLNIWDDPSRRKFNISNQLDAEERREDLIRTIWAAARTFDGTNTRALAAAGHPSVAAHLNAPLLSRVQNLPFDYYTSDRCLKIDGRFITLREAKELIWPAFEDFCRRLRAMPEHLRLPQLLGAYDFTLLELIFSCMTNTGIDDIATSNMVVGLPWQFYTSIILRRALQRNAPIVQDYRTLLTQAEQRELEQAAASDPRLLEADRTQLAVEAGLVRESQDVRERIKTSKKIKRYLRFKARLTNFTFAQELKKKKKRGIKTSARCLPKEDLQSATLQLLRRQGWCCALCGCHLTFNLLPSHHEYLPENLRRKRKQNARPSAAAANDDGGGGNDGDGRAEEDGDPADELGAFRPQNASIDRIIAGDSYWPPNMQMTCAICNFFKGHYSLDVARLIIRRLSRSWWRQEEHQGCIGDGCTTSRLLAATPSQPVPEPTQKELSAIRKLAARRRHNMVCRTLALRPDIPLETLPTVDEIVDLYLAQRVAPGEIMMPDGSIWPMPWASVDRIDNDLWYVAGNMRLVLPQHNTVRLDFNHDEVLISWYDHQDVDFIERQGRAAARRAQMPHVEWLISVRREAAGEVDDDEELPECHDEEDEEGLDQEVVRDELMGIMKDKDDDKDGDGGSDDGSCSDCSSDDGEGWVDRAMEVDEVEEYDSDDDDDDYCWQPRRSSFAPRSPGHGDDDGADFGDAALDGPRDDSPRLTTKADAPPQPPTLKLRQPPPPGPNAGRSSTPYQPPSAYHTADIRRGPRLLPSLIRPAAFWLIGAEDLHVSATDIAFATNRVPADGLCQWWAAAIAAAAAGVMNPRTGLPWDGPSLHAETVARLSLRRWRERHTFFLGTLDSDPDRDVWGEWVYGMATRELVGDEHTLEVIREILGLPIVVVHDETVTDKETEKKTLVRTVEWATEADAQAAAAGTDVRYIGLYLRRGHYEILFD